MNDPAAGCHPLNFIRVDDATVSHAVSVLHPAVKHVRYCLNTAVRVPGKACDVVTLIIRMKVIQQ
jgi:hypothetical protein